MDALDFHAEGTMVNSETAFGVSFDRVGMTASISSLLTVSRMAW